MLQAKEIILNQWAIVTGGHNPNRITQISRQQCIGLCVQGYHSEDKGHREKLKETLTEISLFNFDLIDTDKSG